ncbi:MULTISPECIES: PQQ-dependent sugar dehydrogenase [Candidatus Nitrosocaldus]|jgi:glucose/arabinose dehydrogenase|uniref:Glucose/Sorbosone dehydrogenase domain-containing protein n=1 Tax=Candidatus Nitrosocaldus cavascurensis TaxID=2058097 RepID=A0A2K5AQ60_9ARCH|nr:MULTISPECIES: PQQ-dependent sugar dehydrogenase [Candidatus Nitrosocaldus]SPC33798.1 protein of unknown function [Candidatus Nitrosocaldus cavascurensis]
MKRSFQTIILVILLNITVFLPYSHAQSVIQYEIEEIGKCGFIFEFLHHSNTIICATRGGEIKLLDIINNKLTTLLRINEPDPSFEMGLVGLALDPLFESNDYVYLYWTYEDPVDQKYYKKVSRFVYDHKEKRLTNMKILLDKIPANKNHNGGPIEFGTDGLLYITNGDADDSPQSRKRILDNPFKRGLDALEGKILRIDRDGNVPIDNPYPNSPIYTIGHRNVWGIAFHPITGLPYVTENGPESDDELNILYKGKDYGWPIILGYDKPIVKEEEFAKYNFNPSNYVKPLWSSGHITTAPTQMIFYTGSKYPEFTNDLFFLTLNDNSLNRVKLAPPDYTRISEFHVYPLKIGETPTDIEVDGNGDIYVSTLANKIYRIKFYTDMNNTNIADKRKPVSLHLKHDLIYYEGDVISFKAVLLDINGNPIFYKPINFILDDQVIGTVRTKDDGSASINYQLDLTGKHVMRIEFLGDEDYMYASESYTFVSIAKDMVTKTSTYETLFFDDDRLDPNTIVRLSVFPVEDGKLSNVSPTIFSIELIDKETLLTMNDVEYDLTIVKDDGIVLLSEKGKVGSTIHSYTFGREDSKITLKIRYDDKEATLAFTVVPEFMENALLISILAMLILVSIFKMSNLIRTLHY